VIDIKEFHVPPPRGDAVSEPTAQVAEATENASPGPQPADSGSRDAGPALVEQDLLVEDVSIDGMCGVY
jgi:mycofactocin precursor